MKKLLSLVLLLVLGVVLASCGETPYEADNTEHFDEITKTLKLTASYEGKSFMTDGIGKAKVAAYTDGDTTRFILDGTTDSIVIRYHSIDTPESTGSVEKWGKAASMFNKQQLKSAKEIVLEATGPKPVHDSYGTRYLGYVWYREDTNSDFKCLNLEMVENGYSENKSINSSEYKYYSYFDKAETYAKKIKLRLFSEKEDPLFSNDPVEMTLKEYNENIDAFYNADADSGSKVKFTAYLSALEISNSGTYTFTACEWNADGNIYTANVYAGYVSSAASGMELGHLYEIIGRVAKYNGHYQIADITYNAIYQKETHVIQKNYFVTFNSDVDYISHLSKTLYSSLTVTNVDVQAEKIVFTATCQQKTTGNNYKDEVKTFTFTVNKPAQYSGNIRVGSIVSVQAYQLVANSGEFTIRDYSNLTIR